MAYQINAMASRYRLVAEITTVLMTAKYKNAAADGKRGQRNTFDNFNIYDGVGGDGGCCLECIIIIATTRPQSWLAQMLRIAPNIY